MKKIFFVLLILIIFLISFIWFKHTTPDNTFKDDEEQTFSENENKSNSQNTLDDLIQVDQPQANVVISSPLKFSGKARGTWFFEADFPVVLVDWDGRIIAQTTAQADEDWMTEDYVNFSGQIEFTKPDYGTTGAIIFRKDNPSGLPANDNALEIPIRFE